jgi:hypothetical protein
VGVLVLAAPQWIPALTIPAGSSMQDMTPMR